VTGIAAAGTPESRWRAWSAPTGWPTADLAELAGAVVVAPHPDDEVLGVGGLLARLAVTGRPAAGLVLAVTDGDASHPHATSLSPADLRRLRPAESTRALRCLGVSVPVRRLRQPDNHIDTAALCAALARLLRPGQPCLATWRGDRHPDHEAVGRAAAAACAATGAMLWEYPVWAWHWAVPDDPAVPWERAVRVDLPAPVRAAKQAAIGQFHTQIRAVDGVTILPAAVLAHFDREYEVLLRAG
jgi:LmbE family N-acetylglucosaminyl deacetylase